MFAADGVDDRHPLVFRAAGEIDVHGPGTWSLDFAIMFFAPRKLGAHLNRETGNVSFDRQLAAYIRGLESTTRPRRHQTTAGTHDDPDYRPVQLFNDQTPSIAWARKLPPMLHLETRGRAMRRSAPFPGSGHEQEPTGVIPRAYIRPLAISRRFTVRLLPPGLAGGRPGSISAHSASVRSLG